jgi:hypothetical protein
MENSGSGFPDNLMSIFGFERIDMIPKSKRWQSKKYLEYVRSLPCLVCGQESEPHHIRMNNNAGTGRKPSDTFCVPLCRAHHRECHDIYNSEFQLRHNLDLVFELVQVLRGYVENLP